MNTILRTSGRLLILLTLAISAIRCDEECTLKRTVYFTEPVYLSFEELRQPIASEQPRELQSTGKIYFKDDFIYINEIDKGIHVVDNHDPKHPVHKSFIAIPGNVDLGIRNNILYADSYVDLVAIDISDVGNEHEVNRFKNVFSVYGPLGFTPSPEKGVITDLVLSNKEEEINACSPEMMSGGWGWFEDGIALDASSSRAFFSNSKTVSTNVIGGGASVGIAGSMARFAIRDSHLYAIDGSTIDIVDISNEIDLSSISTVNSFWGIETIFPYGENLFLGSVNAMYIYQITEPGKLKLLSTFNHLRSCDPVVVEGDYAFVTLRTGNRCEGNVNRLEVINISNLLAPQPVTKFDMTNPHGLGIDNDVLFVCDGSAGLKIFDVTDKNLVASRMIKHYPDMNAFDIIPFNNIAMTIAEDGLYQYDYSDIQNIKFLSKLPIKKAE